MKTDNPPLAIHKAMIIIPGILQRELTNNEDPNKVRITQPVNDDPTQVWTITHGSTLSPRLPSRAPYQFLSHDGLNMDHPGSKEAQELIAVIKEEGSHIW
eukprot:15908219-Heterocapsa_arctica.AAC.1